MSSHLAHEHFSERQAAEEPDWSDDVGQVIMAVDLKERGTVGCSYYVVSEGRLYILGDIQLGGKDVIDMLKLEVGPTMLLASMRAEEAAANLQHNRDDQFRFPYQLDIRPAQEFNVSSAKAKLANLDIFQQEELAQFLVPGNGLTQIEEVNDENVGFSFEKGKLLRLAGVVDIENSVSIGCTGAVLTYIHRQRTNEQTISLERDNVSEHAYKKCLDLLLKCRRYISPDTLSSLQILQSESHPNVFNQGPGKTSSQGKEDFSLYGIFHQHLLTPQGKKRLKQYFLRPSIELDIISKRQNIVDVLSRPVNASVVQKLNASLKKTKNMRPIITSLHKGLSTGKGTFGGFKAYCRFVIIANASIQFAFYAIDLQDAVGEIAWQDSIAFRDKALKVLDGSSLYSVGNLIYTTVDIEESQQQQRTIVKSGVDRELDLTKDRYNGLDSLLREVAINIASTIPGQLAIDVNVIYFPQLGFNIAIPFDNSGRAAYIGRDRNWEQIFTTENRAYFKDDRMREMDEELGDIYGLICEREIEIAHELAQKVLVYEKILLESSDLCGELDCYLAMAKTASIYKFVRPQISERNTIRIEDGRHPLQELTVASYVPNDVYLHGGEEPNPLQSENEVAPEAFASSPSMLILTGPNYSGKSVYMKQIALIVYLAHIGSFVPAGKAEIGITDKILTRISTPETVSKIQSTFMIDLQQMSLLLKLATDKSLIVIDEFGKGTGINDGAGLACGIFEYLLSLADKRPRVLAATHFHEIFENGFLPPRKFLEFGHMEVRVDESTRDTKEQLTYLYNFKLGRSNQSFGTFCAAMNGIDPAIVSRANELVSLSARGENLVSACARLSEKEKKILEEAETTARNFLGLDLSTCPETGIKNNLAGLLTRTEIFYTH
ncbi:putative DNA mismatch repair protein Msh5 [Talaromyces proteolyticus]|uniref:DNA mismatch repair protein MSH5 n=1 Tax=Talaromyces proteolyticus TaxID=1131652 RepID=A0AAD4PW19_9EURO|nr:putative DNA mismatch repair protein Msh5 [Talaromyces proteolyticus]KAH8697365.1 putative DNA mismatch repair protein Msh5 [Talaromyces proteolyticus]